MTQLPKTSHARGDPSFVRVLASVDPRGQQALGWEGKLYKPGTLAPIAELPTPAVALESALGGKIERRRQRLYLLWRYDFRAGQWLEMARAEAEDWTWSIALRPLAIRLLHPVPIAVDCEAIAQRIAEGIDAELQRLADEHQGALLSSLDVHLAQRIAAALR